MCMSCKGKKVSSSSQRQTYSTNAAGARRALSSSKYGTPKVRMSFGSRKKA